MKARLSFLLVLALLSATCRSQATGAPTSTLARTTATVAPFPTIASPTATAPPAVAETLTTADASLTGTEAATPATAATGTEGGPLTDRAEFVADVTVPDGADFAPGATFTKTWRVKNVGTSTWTKEYVMEFVLGVNMAAVNKVNFPQDVPPGQTVDLSVEMTAPTTPGTHASLWRFRSPNGTEFGVGSDFKDVIYVQIDVVGGSPASTPTLTGTRAPTRTPSGPLNPIKVTKVTLSIDTANVTGGCPHTFVFTAIIEAEGGGTIRYQLEASTSTEGFKFDLPSPLESTFDTNGLHTHGVQYTLEIRDTVSAQAWVHVLSPNDFQSDKVTFSLTCPTQPPPPPTAAPSATPAGTPTP